MAGDSSVHKYGTSNRMGWGWHAQPSAGPKVISHGRDAATPSQQAIRLKRLYGRRGAGPLSRVSSLREDAAT
jgi:hypothetical protein